MIGVIGIGNIYRRDDAIGIIIAKQIKERLDLDVIESSEPSSILEVIDRYDEVIIIDAMRVKSKVGTVHKFENEQVFNFDTEYLTSTHSLNVVDILKMLKSIRDIPKITLYAIEAADFNIGKGLSKELEVNLEEIRDKIVNDIKCSIGSLSCL